MGRLESPNQRPQDVSFFKIHEDAYDPQTGEFGSDRLIRNNNTVRLRIPSDIKPGDYVMRHELVALHFGNKMNGAQFYISCLNVRVLGSETAEPQGVKFPGAYRATDPGIKYNIYYHVNRYVSSVVPWASVLLTFSAASAWSACLFRKI
jgi:lytic cellulose monooxygenase (C1-hydroxylating)